MDTDSIFSDKFEAFGNVSPASAGLVRGTCLGEAFAKTEGMRVFATAGTVSYPEGYKKTYNAAPGQKMPFPDGQRENCRVCSNALESGLQAVVQ